MAFDIIKAETRTENMMSWLRGICNKITDFNAGSKTRSKIETIAVAMEAQDFEFMQGLRRAIPVAIYRAFSFDLLPPTSASGTVTFSAASAPENDITIPAGIKVASYKDDGGKTTYSTTSAVTMLSGTTSVDANISADVAGSAGNTGAGTITTIETSINGITSVNNGNSLDTGTDRESEDSRRVRFLGYISSLSKGTSDALIYGAKTAYVTDTNGVITEYVSEAYVDGPPTTGSAGTCTLYIYNGQHTSPAASTALIENTQKTIDGYKTDSGDIIPGYKAAGVVVTVSAASLVTINVTATIEVTSGYATDTVTASAYESVTNYINSLGISDDCILPKIIERIMSTEGVYSTTLSTPSASTTINSNQVAIPGTISITAA